MAWPVPPIVIRQLATRADSQVAAEELLRRVSRHTGLEIVEGSRVRPLSPAKWQALARQDSRDGKME
jgi:hypothetical protein